MHDEKKAQMKLTLLATAFFTALVILYGLGIGNYGLFDVTEALTAQISVEMLKTGATGTALFNGQPMVGQFPLMHLAQMGAYQLFEISPFAARIVSAALAFLLVFVAYNGLTNLTQNKRFALTAAAVMALNVPMVLFAKIAVPDSLFWFLTLTSTLMTIGSVLDLHTNYIRVMIAGFLAGGAFLAGGIFGIILPLAIGLAVALVRHQPGHNLRQLSPFTYVLAAFMTLFPWVIGFIKAHDPQAAMEYLTVMFERSWHVGFSPSLVHPKQLLYFVFAFFPWSLFFVPAWLKHLRFGTRELTSPQTRTALPAIAFVWATLGLGIMLFIEVDYSTIFYGMLLPTAILVADLFDRLPEKSLGRIHVFYIVPAGVLLSGLIMLAPQFVDLALGKGGLIELAPHMSKLLPWTLPVGSESIAHEMLSQPVEWGILPVVAGALALVGSMVGVFIMRHGGREASLFVAGGAFMALAIGVWGGLPRAYEYKQESLHWVVQKIEKDKNPKTDHTIVYGDFLPSVRFMLPGVMSYLTNPAMVTRMPGKRLFVITDVTHKDEIEEFFPRGVKTECVGGYCLAELVRLR